MQGLVPTQGAVDPLEGLRDIHLPDPVSWWPLATGWWIVVALVLVVVGLLAWKRVRFLRSLQRFAGIELAALEEAYRQDGDALRLAAGLAELLRRVALARFPRQDVASLHGERWVTFLTEHAEKGTSEVFQLLEDALYAPPSEVENRLQPEEALRATRQWLRRNAA